MKEKLGQEPAFPVTENVIAMANLGMSKRFYAACAAMSGLLANSNPDMVYFVKDKFIKDCCEFADELLKQEFE